MSGRNNNNSSSSGSSSSSRRRGRVRVRGAAEAEAEAAEKKLKSDFSKLQVGDHLSERQHYTVIQVNGDGARLRNDRGFEYDAEIEVVEEGMVSASQATETVKVSRTELVRRLNNSKSIFTVNYNKKTSIEDGAAKIAQWLTNVSAGNLMSDEEHRTLAHNVQLGEDRTLVGYVTHEGDHGRTQVVDVEVPEGEHNLRLVDHRTINWLILDSIKYEAKK